MGIWERIKLRELPPAECPRVLLLGEKRSLTICREIKRELFT